MHAHHLRGVFSTFEKKCHKIKSHFLIFLIRIFLFLFLVHKMFRAASRAAMAVAATSTIYSMQSSNNTNFNINSMFPVSFCDAGPLSSKLDKRSLAKIFDHTILKADTVESEVRRVCQEAKEHNFASVCVNPSFVPTVTKELKGWFT